MNFKQKTETFELLRKDGSEYTVVGDVVEGQQYTVEDEFGFSHTGSVRIKKVYCGKRCRGCPHASYAYVRYRSGKKTKEKYLGVVKGDAQ